MPLTNLEHSPRERPGLGIVKYTKPDTQDSSSKSVSDPIIVRNTKPVTTSVPTKLKNDEHESKINELTKLIQMLMNEKVKSSQKIQESKHVILRTESSKSVNSSQKSQESKLRLYKQC
ncbi:hypothetical protein Tco_0910878 [Tanacetum coccineum]|uniref:Ty3-gypsy retrotransposon protein n=1 Tax=Tanacetum coccineum TaxID=301880 RepID=A0ABQ5CWC1_9ASTR